MMRAMLLLISALCLLGADGAHALTVRAVVFDFDFTADDELLVAVHVDDAVDLVALEFSVVYPGDLLAVDQPPTWNVAGPFSHGFVNASADSSDLPAGQKRISVAFAVASPVTRSSEGLLGIHFPLRCSDFSGGWPDGRSVTIEIQDAAAWTAQGSGLPAPVAVTAQGRTINVDCTTVPLSGSGFSMLKARHTSREGSK